MRGRPSSTDPKGTRAVCRRPTAGEWFWAVQSSHGDEAVEIANDSDFVLSAGVWGEDLKTAVRVAHRLETGSVWVNDWHAIDVAYPFGGYKQSGSGRELGPDALHEYTERSGGRSQHGLDHLARP